VTEQVQQAVGQYIITTLSWLWVTSWHSALFIACIFFAMLRRELYMFSRLCLINKEELLPHSQWPSCYDIANAALNN
jgi:hypothetical protein